VVADKANEISQHFPTFTRHGLDHVDTVRAIAQTLSKALNLTAEERFCLDAACLAHDLGMAHTKAQEAYALENRESVRRWHARLSAQFIHNELSKTCFLNREPQRDAVARIVEGHGRWDWDSSFFEDDSGIRIRLLTALLSLADALDIRNARRVPDSIDSAEALLKYPFLSETAKQNPAIARIPALADLSRVHWLRHYYSVQPGVSMKNGGRTALIRLKARIGLQNKDADHPMRDEREPLIKELIQSEVVELLEFEPFKKALETHLTVTLAPSADQWPSFVEAQDDPTRMLFPGELVEAAFAARMVRPRTLRLDRDGYFKTRIEGFIGPSDVQVSISWLPSAVRTDQIAAKPIIKSADQTIRGLAERTWDFVLWPIGPFVSLLRSEALNAPTVVEERLRRMWDITQKIRAGKYRAYYIALDQPLSPQPITATSHVAKFAFYTGLPAMAGDFLGGAVELGTAAQQSAFQTTCEAAARALHITGDRHQLPELLRANADHARAFTVTVQSIQQILAALRRELQGTAVSPELTAFLEAFGTTLRDSLTPGPAR
jgi:hypothetical protein